MRPCIGIAQALPPLCQWRDMLDGTLTLEDVTMFHEAMDAIEDQMQAARQ